MTISTTVAQINNSDSDGCILLNELFTVTPEFTLDAPSVGCTIAVLTYTLSDHNGTVLSTLSYDITIASPEDPTTLTFTYTPTAVGDLTLSTSLEECGTTVTENQTISVCDYISLINSACHTFTLGNFSLATTVYATFTELDGTVIGTELDTISPNEEVELETELDGIYYLNIYSDSAGTTLIQTYVIIDSCDIEACVSTLTLQALCSDCDTSECTNYYEKLYNLIQIELLAFAFFSKANRERSLNRVYTVIEDSKVVELENLDALITQILRYCDSCGTTENFRSNTLSTNSTGDCGCE